MNVHVVPLDPYHPTIGGLVPIVAQRIINFAKEFTPEFNPRLVAQAIMVPLWAQDGLIRVLAFVDDGGVVVGHAIASVQSDGVNHWVMVSQCQADHAVGDAVKRGIIDVSEWVKRTINPALAQQGKPLVTQMVMATGRNEKSWERAYGFRVKRRVMYRDIAGALDASDTTSDGEMAADE